MGYKAVYPAEVVDAHRAFIARRRSTRPGEEYRTPTDAEWDEFLGHFERRKVAYGTCGRSYNTPCIHEHSCLRCPLLRPDPAQRTRLAEVHGNLLARIAEAEREGWLGEVEGLKVSLAGAQHKLAQLDELAARRTTVHLGTPDLSHVVGRNLRRGTPVTHPADLAWALRAHAQGVYCLEAAVNILIGHQAWLRRADFCSQFTSACHGTSTTMAYVDWPAAVAALETGCLPCSSGEDRMLRIAASLAEGIPVDLGDVLTGLDTANVDLVVEAVLHASGRRQTPRLP